MNQINWEQYYYQLVIEILYCLGDILVEDNRLQIGFSDSVLHLQSASWF